MWDVTKEYDNEVTGKGVIFLLTHPVWDVTCWVRIYLQARQDFYSHIPCGM